MKEQQNATSLKTDSSITSETTNSEQTWHGVTYCRKVRHVSCEGEGHISDDAPNLCPYFDEMLY